jgi:hypothetical protein
VSTHLTRRGTYKHHIATHGLPAHPSAIALSPAHERLDLDSVVGSLAASPHRNGLLLLFGALGLLLLVLAGGSTLRMLVRMDGKLKAG